MRTNVSSWALRFAAPIVVSMALAHCGAVTPMGAGVGDQPEAGADVGECDADGACPSGSSCFFPIGSCDTKGQCIEDPAPGTPQCEAIEILCGCDGADVTAGCGFPGGYASGPTMGGSSCGGVPTEPDGGTDAGSLPEAGAHVGPCGDGGACPSGSSCFFAIGSCPQTGECIENPAPDTPECGAIEILCGCDGTTVTSGCGFPDGYASGPTSGESSCGTLPTRSDGGTEAGAGADR
jgi:hypothetical protein